MPENTEVLTQRPDWKHWLRAGFFSTLGASGMLLLAFISWRLFGAALTVITPFVIGLALALFLDPLADRLEKRGLRRGPAVAVVFGGFMLLLVGIGAVVVPALVGQAGQLAENGPRYVASVREYIDDFLNSHHHILGISLPPNFAALSAQISDQVSATLRRSAGGFMTLLLGSVTALIETVVVLIVTLYLLLDIDRLRARLFYLAPASWRGPMTVLGQDIGRVFSEYVRGMVIVSVLYGVATLCLLLGLSAVHHEVASYALLVAFAGGLLYAVPYVGPLVTALVTFLVAFAAGGVGFGGIGVGLTLVLNQVFDNIVTPRVVGGGVGLHPVASLFALTLGGALFGLWGLLLSVPVAASVQVILLHLFPKLATPTPDDFLKAEGVAPDDAELAKVMEGDIAQENRQEREEQKRRLTP